MNKILLINRIDPQNHPNHKEKTFFMIGDMDVPSIDNKLIDIISKSNIVEPDDVVLKYNGIELNIATQNIPDMIELLVKNKFSIYGVYQIYNPDK